MNPGAASKTGWHKTRTINRKANDGSDIKNCEVIELGKKMNLVMRHFFHSLRHLYHSFFHFSF
jgi:hypothetical protein